MLREDKFTLFDIANFIHDSKMNVAEVELITYFVRKLKSFYNRELGKESIANIEPKQPLPNAALAACFERLCVKAEEELKISRELLDHIDNVLNQNIPATTPERLAVIMHHNVVADFVLKFFESLDQALIEKLNTLEQISHLFKDEQNASLPVEGVFRKVAGCLSGADNKTEDVSKKDETVKNLFKFSAPLKTENDNLPEKDDDIDNFIDILNRKQDANMSEIRKTSESMSIRPSVQIGDSFDRSLSKKQAGGAFEGLTRNQFEATDNDRLGNLNFDPKSKDKTLPKFGALKPFANIDNIMAGKQLNLFSELPSIQKGQELAFKSDNELQFSLGGKPGEEGAKTVGEAKSKDTLGNADLPEALKDPSVIELLKDPDFVKALKTIAQSEKKIKDNSGFSNRGIGAITETEDTINLSRDRTRGKSVGSAEKYSSHQKTNLSRENVLQIGKLLNTPQRDTAVSNNNQTEGGVGKSEFYLQQLKETLSQRLQSTAKGTTENDTLGKSGYVPNRLLERAVADQMNRILDLKDPDLLTKSVFKEKIDESVFEPRAVTLGKPDSQVGRFTKYETLLPPDYYTFLAKKNVEMDDKKWFLRAHHIESLTENPASVKDNLVDAKYISFYGAPSDPKKPAKKTASDDYKANLVKELQEQRARLTQEIQQIKENKIPREGSTIRNDRAFKEVAKYFQQSLKEKPEGPELVIKGYEGVLTELRSHERDILNQKRHAEAEKFTPAVEKWWELKTDDFNQHLKKHLLQVKSDPVEYEKLLKYYEELKTTTELM